MGRKKLAVPWILFGITAIAFVILVLVIAVRDGNASKQQLSIQNADGDSSPNFQDYSKYYARKGYYMRDDGGVSLYAYTDMHRWQAVNCRLHHYLMQL